MSDFQYLNPYRPNHFEFAKYLQDSLKNVENIRVVNYENSVQHIFIKDTYYMTLDWLKI